MGLSFRIDKAIKGEQTGGRSQRDDPDLKLWTHQSETTQSNALNALANQIAQIEVQRILAGERLLENHPQMAQLKEQQTQLEKRVAELQPGEHQALIHRSIAQAIDSKIVEIEIQSAKDQAKFTKEHPILQVQASQIEALRQRLDTLQK